MANINGTELSRKDIHRYAGNLSQIAGIRHMTFADGRGKGSDAYEVKTGSGFCFTLVPDRNLDIIEASYKGVNISYLGKGGPISPFGFAAFDDEFGSNMTGGLMFTAGTQNAGPACRDDDGSWQPTHGRIGFLPSENHYARADWQGDEYLLEAGGVTREGRIFGHNLSLTRKICTKMGAKGFTLTDVLENNSPEDTEIMMLYHFNLGFPFLNDNIKLILPEGTKTIPRTEQAKNGLAQSKQMTKPADGFFEHVFFNDLPGENGICCVKAENDKLGFGIYLKYNKDNLPVLTQWKSMRSGDYALGLEPSNSYIHGRKGERENGTLRKIPAFGKLEYTIEFGVYDL